MFCVAKQIIMAGGLVRELAGELCQLNSNSAPNLNPFPLSFFLERIIIKLPINKCNRKKKWAVTECDKWSGRDCITQRSALHSQLLYGLDSVAQGSNCWLYCLDYCFRSLTLRAECAVHQDWNHQNPEVCRQNWLPQYALHLESINL